MSRGCNDFLKYAFNAFCFIVAFSMIGFWTHQFLMDLDLSRVEYKAMKDIDQNFPMLSMCFTNPIIEERLRDIHPNLTKSLYLQVLNGDLDYDLVNVYQNYHNVTFDLGKYFTYYKIKWKNGSMSTGYQSSDNFIRSAYELTYSGFARRNVLIKCFGAVVNKEYAKEISRVAVFYKKQIFSIYPKGLRPSKKTFYTTIHLPGQFTLSKSRRLSWMTRKDDQGYYMHFTLKMMEYLRRRNKHVQPCLEESTTYDREAIEKSNQNASCKPPYLIDGRNITTCFKKEELKKFYFDVDTHNADDFYPPCDTIEFVVESYEEFDMTFTDSIALGMTFPDRVKIIEQSKEICFHVLVGNCGGYLGIFIGK